MWFALLLLVSLTVWWIGGPVLLVVGGGLVTFALWPEIAWAVGALVALAWMASLAGWFDRLHEWFVERVDRVTAD